MIQSSITTPTTDRDALHLAEMLYQAVITANLSAAVASAARPGTWRAAQALIGHESDDAQLRTVGYGLALAALADAPQVLTALVGTLMGQLSPAIDLRALAHDRSVQMLLLPAIIEQLVASQTAAQTS